MLRERKPFLSPNAKQLPLGDAVLRFLLTFVALNGLGLWLAKSWLYERPLFNIDYMLAALIYIWISRTLAAGVLVLLVATECARYLIPTYFYSQQAFSLLFWARATTNWPPLVQLTGFVLGLAAILVITLLFRRYRLTGWAKIGLTAGVLFGIALLALLDSLNGTSSKYNLGQTGSLVPMKIVGSPLHLIFEKTRAVLRGEKATFATLPATATATGRYFSETLAAAGGTLDWNALLTATNAEILPHKLVVVVFESFSALTADPELKQWRAPFRRVEDRYTLEAGTLDWVGATLRGEVRELCWQAIDGNEISTLPPALPATLKKLGYETTAFHGFAAGMYDRDRIYPLLGFDHVVLLEQMRQNGDVPRAGMLFNGARDDYVATLVHQDILRPGKRLTYWMTLTSHVPINIPLAEQLATPADLAVVKDLPRQVWAYTVICRKTLESIAKIAADPALADYDFVIVGDHKLPVTDVETKSYIMPNKVAYLILRHKK